MKENEEREEERRGIQTTGIVIEVGGRKIALHANDRRHSIENLDELLNEEGLRVGKTDPDVGCTGGELERRRRDDRGDVHGARASKVRRDRADFSGGMLSGARGDREGPRGWKRILRE